MPFTLAHPAAVLPLRHTRLVFSALVIGSLMPDVPYFVTLSDTIRWGHSLAGVFLFCLPAGLGLLWLFHAVVKRPLLALAPEYVRVRVEAEQLEFRFGPWRRFLLIVGSLLVGTFSHILWDGFTHEHGYFVKHWLWLSMRVAAPFSLHHTTPLWRALQQGCSVLGIAVIVVVSLWWWKKRPVLANPIPAALSPAQRHGIVLLGIVLACALGLAGGYTLEGHRWKRALVESVIVAITAGCGEILLFSIGWRLARRKKEKPLDGNIQRLKMTSEP